ncbi:MAG: ABC transporter permease [Chitinophagaceae bacterium]
MNKIWLIIKREYSTRVRNKTFLLSTFLLPVAMVALIAGGTYLSFKGKDNHKIAVLDPNGFFKEVLQSDKGLTFEFPAGVDSSNYQSKGYTDLLVVPKWDGVSNIRYDIRSPKQLGLSARGKVEDKINEAIDKKILLQNGVSTARLDSLRKIAPKATINELAENGEKSKVTSSGLSYGIGFGSGMLIYIMMFIYGAQVMRGVMEEKTNRIAEVVVSSVKPFQLMIGKIIGIGGVGLTQFLLWLVLIFGLAAVANMFISHETLQQVQEMQQSTPMGGGGITKTAEASQNILGTLANANWFKIIPFFLFYFLGGYLFYAALFASVGCMVNEDPQDAQSLMLPIMMPIVFGFIIMQGAIQNPNSAMAVWGSIIPFTSPIVMMARIPSDPPLWQIALSMVLLIGGFIGTGWMAGKIYRTGILMYGKKGNWKQMMKWVFTKG